MSTEQIAKKIENVLKKAGCPSATTCIISNRELGFSRPGNYISVGASDPIEIDKIQAVMAMTEAKFVKWHKNELDEFMIYFMPSALTP